MTSRQIAAEMIVQRGLAAKPKLLNLIIRRAAGCLRDEREQGHVETRQRGAGSIWDGNSLSETVERSA